MHVNTLSISLSLWVLVCVYVSFLFQLLVFTCSYFYKLEKLMKVKVQVGCRNCLTK